MPEAAQHPAGPVDVGARPSTLLWLPLALIVVALAWSAWHGAAPGASHASAATTIDVTGNVTEYVYLDASGCSTAPSLDLGELVINDPWKRTSADCAILFGTSNSGLGADLNVLEDPGAPPSPGDAMKCVVATCTGGSWDGKLDDVAAASSPPSGSTSAFGTQLESASGLASSVWSVGPAYPVDTASTACNTAAIGDGTCAFRFGASANVNDGPGAYQAQVQFLVLAR